MRVSQSRSSASPDSTLAPATVKQVTMLLRSIATLDMLTQIPPNGFHDLELFPQRQLAHFRKAHGRSVAAKAAAFKRVRPGTSPPPSAGGPQNGGGCPCGNGVQNLPVACRWRIAPFPASGRGRMSNSQHSTSNSQGVVAAGLLLPFDPFGIGSDRELEGRREDRAKGGRSGTPPPSKARQRLFHI